MSSLDNILDQVIKEALDDQKQMYRTALKEKEKQQEVAPQNEEAEQKTSSKSIDLEKKKLTNASIKTKDIIGLLNTIRAGKSFKDETLAKTFDEYIRSLSSAEKVALYAFLKGIAQIMTGTSSAQDAMDPSDAPSDVEMQKKNITPTEKKVKPTIEKTFSKEKPSSAEDTTPPAPITPVKK